MPRNNLPLQLTSFVGREKEIAEIIDLVAKHRLVTLTGSGGVGKTRLSLQTAGTLLNNFPNGIWFVELAPLSDSMLIPQAIVNALGLLEQPNRSSQTILLDFLKDKKTLLILDNCEHVIQACAQLAESLVQTCSDLHILTTSREVLELIGETLYRVPSLTTPTPTQSTFENASQYEAVRLFLERAQSLLPEFSLTQDNAHAVKQICQRLDGIPLALELAAARVKGLNIEQIATRLDDRFHLLTSGNRTALPRHQTLQALIDWSYDLLTESERILLCRLSVFAGGWTLEAAEAVCASNDLESNQILELLLRLVDKSLVIAETQKSETRYHMLETIRQYAHEKSWQAGEGELIRQQHLAYFVDLAERAKPHLRAFGMIEWLDRLEAELDNIRVALEYALESDIETQLRIASALLWFWHIRGHKNEGIDWLERGLSIEKAERGSQPLISSRAMIRGKALNATGILWDMSLVSEAAKYFQESLEIFTELGPVGKPGRAYAFWGLASLGDETTRKAMKEQSLTLFRELGDKFGAAECLMNLTFFARISGDHERARTLQNEQLALRKEIGDKDGIAMAQAGLGFLALVEGDYQRAMNLIEESLEGFRKVGNKWGFGLVLPSLSRVALEQGNQGQATRILEEALVIGQNLGDKRLIINGLNDLGKLAWAQGNYKLAEERFTEELKISQESGDEFVILRALQGLGRVAQSQEDYATARSLYSNAITQGVNNRWIRAMCLSAFASLAVTQNQPGRAAHLGGAAEKLLPAIRFEMSPAERSEYDQAINTARAARGEEAFMKLWEEGQKMTPDEAVAYALEDTEINLG